MQYVECPHDCIIIPYRYWRVNTSPELCSYRKGPTPILHQTMFRFATGEPPNTITTQARGKRTSASQRWEAGGRARASCQSRLLRPVVTNWGGRRRTMPSSARRLSRTVRESLRRARCRPSGLRRAGLVAEAIRMVGWRGVPTSPGARARECAERASWARSRLVWLVGPRGMGAACPCREHCGAEAGRSSVPGLGRARAMPRRGRGGE